MIKVKLLKDLTRYNIMGYDIKVFTGKKDEVVELTEQRAANLIKDGLAVEVIEEKPSDETPSTGTESSGAVTTDLSSDNSDDDDDFFTLDAKTIADLKGMGKDELEAILRNYSIEVDKRRGLPAIHKELIEAVSTSLPSDVAVIVGDNMVEPLIKFYNDKFGILLDKECYAEDKLSELTEDMGALLKGALSDEDS